MTGHLPRMHETFMREAIRLAVENAGVSGGGRFGAVIVQGERILGRGVNRVTLEQDPTAHADISSMRSMGRRARSIRVASISMAGALLSMQS